MARVTHADVTAIMVTTLDTTPFIAAATLLVDAYLLDAGLDAGLLFEIERWWAAHLATIQSPGVSHRRIGDTALQYERGKLGMGLEATLYGQQVLLFDTSGTLAEVEAGIKPASFHVF